MLKKFFIIVLGALSTNLWAVETKVDTITVKTTGATSTTYVDWAYKAPSGIQYIGNSAKDQNSTAMQIAKRTKDDKYYSGIVSTNSINNYFIREVRVIWHSTQDREILIFGSTKAIALKDLYNDPVTDTIGFITNPGQSIKINNNFPYIGIRTKKNAALIDTIFIVWGAKQDGGDVTLQSISLDKDTLLMETEDEEQLTVSYLPTNATYKGVTWSSSNNAIATVNNGTVTAVAPGGVYIYATSTDGQALKDSCYVGVRKKDIFKGRDIYYKITCIDSLHNGDSIILVNEQYNRASAQFETYTYKKKNEKQDLIEYTAGRLAPAETEIVREADSIGCWGVENLTLVKTAQGWQIKATIYEVAPYGEGEIIATETLLRANQMNKLMIKGEGNTFWNISFTASGDAEIASQDATAGKMQFNTDNKTFTTYTSTQGAVQIYRLKGQHIDPQPIVPPITPTTLPQNKTNTLSGIRYNLLGQPVEANYQGIVIRDGQLYLMR